MKKIILWIFVTVCLLSITTATECQISPDNLTWSVLNSTLYGGCIDTPNNLASVQNLNESTTYYVRCKDSTTDYGYISFTTDDIVEETDMWVAAILLLPLGLCFFFVYLANTLSEEHNPLKWFFRLLALIMIFVIYQGVHILTQLNSTYSAMADMFSITVYGWIFWVIMGYILIYLLINIFRSFKHNKEWDNNEEWMK